MNNYLNLLTQKDVEDEMWNVYSQKLKKNHPDYVNEGHKLDVQFKELIERKLVLEQEEIEMKITNDFNSLPFEEKEQWTLDEYKVFRSKLREFNHNDALIFRIHIDKENNINYLKLKTIEKAVVVHIHNNNWHIFSNLIYISDDNKLSELLEFLKFTKLQTFRF